LDITLSIGSYSVTAPAVPPYIGKPISDRVVAGRFNFSSFWLIQLGEKKQKE